MEYHLKSTFSGSWIQLAAIIFSWLIMCSSCSVKRNVPDGSMIVKKNIVTIDDSDVFVKSSVTSSELKDYISLPKNRSFLRINLWAYNRKNTKLKKWAQKIMDNPPSYFDNTKADQGTHRIESYLNNRGYFKSQVSYTVKTQKNHPKKAIINYQIKLAKPYTIKEIDCNIPDSCLAKIISLDYITKKIKVGQQYDFYKLDDLRNNITNDLRNQGYLFLNPDYVFYEIDSSFRNNSVKITLNIRPNYLLESDSKNVSDDFYNKIFYFNDIFVQPNFQPRRRSDTSTVVQADTVTFLRPRYKNIKDSLAYTIIQTEKPYMRYKSLMPSIYLESGDLYRESNIKKTQSTISGLSAIGYCNIILDTVPRWQWPDSANIGLVNGTINLSKGMRQGYSVGLEATNNGGALGASVNLTYNNKNIFRGSEMLSLQLKLATEIQSSLGNNNMNYSFWLFNTLEGGIQATFTFPRFLAPINQYRFPKFFRPKTNISIGYNFQKRPDYNRDIVLTSFGYFWKPEIKQSHRLTLLDINTVKINKTDDFENQLKSYNNKRLYEQYSDHLIMALNYTFTFSTQEYGKAKNFVYVQTSLESAGNLLYGINSAFNSPMTDVERSSYYTLFGIRYAEYLKGYIELRRYCYFGNYNHLAYRGFVGVGVPYGNALSMPFEKSFYGGGANDLRGWEINKVGPGGFSDNSSYERSGDIKIEANAEFRFGLISFLKGAVFTDLGNVWLLRNDSDFPNGNFTIKDFYKQLYWDAGFGLRLDFSFFLIRVDAAIPLYNPGSTHSTKWVVNKMKFNDIILSFGIGYPF